MKTMVKLTVLMATLLLLTGVAFANGGPCYYYEYVWTDLNPPFTSDTSCTELCFNYGDHTGTYSNFCGSGDLVLFFDPMNKQALLYATGIYPEVGYIKFHGDSLHVFTGIEYCEYNGRFQIRGHKVDGCKE